MKLILPCQQHRGSNCLDELQEKADAVDTAKADVPQAELEAAQKPGPKVTPAPQPLCEEGTPTTMITEQLFWSMCALCAQIA